MSASSAFAVTIDRAQSAVDRCDWDSAGRHYVSAGWIAMDAGEDSSAREVFIAGGEAFRRADRVLDAQKSLSLALSLGGSVLQRGLAQIQLSGVLCELGRFEEAAQQCQEVTAVKLLPMAADSLVSVRLGTGSLSQIEAALASLETLSGPVAELAILFRRAQVERLRGDLSSSLDRLDRLEERLVEVKGGEAGLGGILAERADIHALVGDSERAIAAWAESARDYELVGRTSLMWRACAGQTRCEYFGSAAVTSRDYSGGIGWSERHELVVLSLDLRVAKGLVDRDVHMLQAARTEALALGLTRRAGRAELARSLLLPPASRLAALQDAVGWLRGDVPWTLRAKTHRIKALSIFAAAQARTLAEELLPAVRSVGMVSEIGILASL